MATNEKSNCLVPGCTKKEDTKGLCATDYQFYRRQVKRGETSWEELEELGLAKPDSPPGRKSRNNRAKKALEAARKRKAQKVARTGN